MKIGYGLYARAARSPFNAPIPAKDLATLTDALKRLGIETVPTRLERAYNAGQTTQVPSGRVVGVTQRVRRKVGYNGFSLSFEHAGSAPH